MHYGSRVYCYEHEEHFSASDVAVPCLRDGLISDL